MDKVICDICGTSYPAASATCPICGCEKPVNPASDGDAVAPMEDSDTYKPVRGGRFSNANVRKRNKNAAVAASRDTVPDGDDEQADREEEGSSKGLIVVLIVLILAILGMIMYLYFNFFAPVKDTPKDTEPMGTTTAATTELIETQEPTVPCTGIEVSEKEIILDGVGSAWLLNVVATPEDTTDAITYTSSNEAVATVSNEGRVVAVAPGEAVITVTCGSVTVECKVTCVAITEPATTPATEPATQPETEPATQPTTQPATEPAVDASKWAFRKTDVTIYIGDGWQSYLGEVDTEKLTFQCSDTDVVTISKKGFVKAVGEGYATITVEYNGEKQECIVRVRPAKAPTEDKSDSKVG